MELGFHYRDGQLYCDGVAAESIAEHYGTPCYVYSASMLRERFRRIRSAFARWDPLVCFSVKACGNISILKLLAESGSGFDVVSGGEIYRVLRAGGSPDGTIYAGVGKTAAEIEYALESGIRMFNVESASELRALDSIARRCGKTAAAAIRVNPDVDPNTHVKTTTGKKENKFGIGLRETEELLEQASSWPGVAVRGIHFHLGSPIYSTAPYELALEKMLQFIPALRRRGCAIDTLNLGGGYCISYTGEQVPGPEDYASCAESFLEKLNCEVIIEPGRYIAGGSGLLLTRVIYRKESHHGKRFLICEAAMNDLVRPTLYEAFHRIWPVRSAAGMPEVIRPEDPQFEGLETETVDVVGPVCESGDYLARHRALPPVAEGKLLAVFDVGAYGFSMSSNYNARPRPPEVLVDGKRHALVRRRETYEDLVGPETDLSSD